MASPLFRLELQGQDCFDVLSVSLEKAQLENNVQAMKKECLSQHINPLQELHRENNILIKDNTHLRKQNGKLKKYVEELEKKVEANNDVIAQMGELLREIQHLGSGNPSDMARPSEDKSLKKELAKTQAQLDRLENCLAKHANNLKFIKKDDYFKTLKPFQKSAINYFCTFATSDDDSDSTESDREASFDPEAAILSFLNEDVEPVVPMQTEPLHVENELKDFADKKVQTCARKFMKSVALQASLASTPQHAVTQTDPVITDAIQERITNVKDILKKMCHPFGPSFKPVSPISSPNGACAAPVKSDTFTVDAAHLAENFTVNVKLPSQEVSSSRWVRMMTFSFDLDHHRFVTQWSYNTQERSAPNVIFYC